MTDASGTWDLEAVTPFGSQALRLELAATGSAVTGTAIARVDERADP